MEEDICSTLQLFFIGDIKQSIFSGYKAIGKYYDFKTNIISIPNCFFGPRKEKKIIDFQLILKEEEKFSLVYCPHRGLIKRGGKDK